MSQHDGSRREWRRPQQKRAINCHFTNCVVCLMVIRQASKSSHSKRHKKLYEVRIGRERRKSPRWIWVLFNLCSHAKSTVHVFLIWIFWRCSFEFYGFFTQSGQWQSPILPSACNGTDTRSCSIIKFNSTPTHITRRMSSAAVKLNDRTLSLWNNNSSPTWEDLIYFFREFWAGLTLMKGWPMTCRRLPRRVQNFIWWLVEIHSKFSLFATPFGGSRYPSWWWRKRP